MNDLNQIDDSRLLQDAYILKVDKDIRNVLKNYNTEMSVDDIKRFLMVSLKKYRLLSFINKRI